MIQPLHFTIIQNKKKEEKTNIKSISLSHGKKTHRKTDPIEYPSLFIKRGREDKIIHTHTREIC